MLWRVVVVVVVAVIQGGAAEQSLYHTQSLESVALNHVQRSALDLGNIGLYLPVSVSPTSPCGQALNAMTNALINNNNNNTDSWWAAKMVDSWGKTTDGILIGGKLNGIYDECVGTASPDNTIKGKYCRIHMYKIQTGQTAPLNTRQHLPLGNTPRKMDLTVLGQGMRQPRTGVFTSGASNDVEYGTCIPDVCTKEELQNTIIPQVVPQGLWPAMQGCELQDIDTSFTDADVGFTALITFLLVLILCASLVDIYIQYTDTQHLNKGALRYLLVFSAYTNLPKILQVNPKASPGNITCLHAMRTLSMTWVMWCHQQTIFMPNTANILLQLYQYDGILAQAIVNGYPSVDTFFFLSGLLVSYSVLRSIKKTKSFNIIIFYVHRILRIVPPIGIMCGFEATVMRFFVTGYFAYTWKYWQENCADKWWRDVTFVNNFMYETGSCLGQTWYIAADMQMYLVAPIIILPLYFYKNFGMAWLFLLTAVSCIIPATITYVNDLPPTQLMGVDQDIGELAFKLIYMPPWTRACPWIAGVWLGYIFYVQGNTRYKMRPLVVTVGWTLAAITGVLVVFGLFKYNQIFNRVPYEVMTQVTYGGLHRLAWGASLAWVVFACHNGYGGLVNDFLSHPVWQPISRLTYVTYLVAFPMQYFIFYNINGGTYYFTHLNLIISTVGAVVITLPFAVLLSLMAESPIVGLEKLLLFPSRSSSPRKPSPVEGKQGGDTPLNPPPPPHPDSETTKLSAGVANPVFVLHEEGTQPTQHDTTPGNALTTVL